jgi:hypothetical protein
MISRGQMYRQMYNIGGEGIMSLDAGAPSIKYEGDIKPRQEVADVNLPLDVQGWFQSLSFEQQLQLLSSDIDEAYKVELRKLLGKNMQEQPMQDQRQMVYKGGIMNVVPRDHALFGGLKNIVKKATNVVKDVIKSPIGKAALLGAGAYYLGGGFGRLPGGFKFANIPGVPTLFGSSATGPTMFGSPSASTPGIFTKAINAVKGLSTGQKLLGTAAISGFTGFLADQGLSEEEIKTISSRPDEVRPYLKLYYEKSNPIKPGETEEEYQARVQQFLTTNLSEYDNKAYGGRMGYNSGTFPLNKEPEPETDLMKAAKQKAQAEGISIQEALKQLMERNFHAYGGRMMKALGDTAQMASGIEGLPLRQNPMGTNEVDMRDTGGFIPPVGIKEKADDIPAMLSNNEFVFTADAVRGMGGGDVNLGAQRMYDMMKKLENGGRV